jgi:hypothetical protein
MKQSSRQQSSRRRVDASRRNGAKGGRPRTRPADPADSGGVAIYHKVRADEGFEASAETLFGMIREAQAISPGKRRILYLDIEGHRNTVGGFDGDMLELQKEFAMGFLAEFLSELRLPLFRVTRTTPQNNDIPEALMITPAKLG